MNPIRLLLVDDSEIFLEAICAFLARHRQFEVVGLAQDGASALRLAHQMQPDLVLLDISLENECGLDLIPGLRQINPHLAIIILTLLGEELYKKYALLAGADAYLTKTNLASELLPNIDQILGTRNVEHVLINPL